MLFTYPGDSLDEPRRLLALLGGFWQHVFGGREMAADVVESTARAAKQRQLDFLELLASVSRFELPVLHRENWQLFAFRQSAVNSDELRMAVYDGSEIHSPDTALQYGVPSRTLQGWSVAAPADLRRVRTIVNRTVQASLVWTEGVDFTLRDGILTFRTDPFAEPLIAVRDLFEGGEIVDREAGLWLFHGEFDRSEINRQFAYALKLVLESTEHSKTFLNALLDGLAVGTTVRDMHFAWSSLTGVPLTIEVAETVEEVVETSDRLLVLTDRHAYEFPAGSTAVVAAGDVLAAGDPLTDTLRFFDFRDGSVPFDDLASLTFGHEFLGTGYLDGLTFRSGEVPLEYAVDDDGFARVSFELGGFPGDVERFWDAVHARGRAAGRTLAHLLDVRAEPAGEPAPENLPATVDPLRFLCANLLRHHFWGVRIRAGRLPEDRLGLHLARQLRRIVPPHTALLVLLELEQSETLAILEGGDGEVPGYAESLTGFSVTAAGESIDPASVSERIVVRQLQGHCE